MFSYCGNDPVNRVDPTGQSFESVLSVYAGITALVIFGGLLMLWYDATHDQVLSKGIDFAINSVYEFARSISDQKDEEKTESIVIPRDPNSTVVFPADPNSFNPVGLVKVHRPGTKNGVLISWMDPITNTEIFRWDENPNLPNGPHYHIYGKGHYYPGMSVPEPYATIYFP